MEFCERLRSLRKERGLTQIELAEKAGIAVNSVRLYESGKITPKLDSLQKIAGALNVGIETLFAPDQLIKQAVKEAAPKMFQEPDALKRVVEKTHLLTIYQSEDEREKEIDILCIDFCKLNLEGRKKAIERVHELTEVPRYQLSIDPVHDTSGGTDDDAAPDKK